MAILTDYGQNIVVDIETDYFDTALMGEDIKPNEKIVIKGFYIKYSASEDFTFGYGYRIKNKDDELGANPTEMKATYEKTTSATRNDNYAFIPVYPVRSVGEFYLKVLGSFSESFEIKSMGVIWNKVPVGRFG